MADNLNAQKQDADEDKAPEQVERDGFTAEEIGQASIYDSTSEVAQQMRRGDETNDDPKNHDVVGSSDPQRENKESYRE